MHLRSSQQPTRHVTLLSANEVNKTETDRKKWSSFQKVRDRRETYAERVRKLDDPDLRNSLLKLLQKAREGYFPDGDLRIAAMLLKANLASGTEQEKSVTQELLKECRQVQLDNAGAYARSRIGNFISGAFTSIWDKLRSAASQS
mmetsp:Transcript_74640/g.132027  ORF Transcript_74640/g.132027 Transcript_74640/m.132027 type:complete len:145 (+) Transcript_74640:125-559(+)